MAFFPIVTLELYNNSMIVPDTVIEKLIIHIYLDVYKLLILLPMRNPLPLFFAFCVGLNSCSTEPIHEDVSGTYNPSDRKIFEVFLDKGSREDALFLSTISSQARVIVLETTPESMIGAVSKLVATDSMLCVLDKRSKAVLLFDTEGRFLTKVGKVGRGPGEYTSISDCAIASEGETINVLDANTQVIHQYNFRGSYIASVHLDGSLVRSFNILASEGSLYGDAFFARRSPQNYLLRRINAQTGREEERFLNIRYNKNWERIFFFGPGPFYSETHSPPKYIPLFSDTVFCIDQSHIIPYLVLKSGDLISTEMIQDFSGKEDTQLISEMMRTQKVYGISHFCELRDYVLLGYRFANSLPWCLFNKTSGKTQIFKRLFDDLVYKQTRKSMITEVACSDSHGFYSVISSRHLPMFLELLSEGSLHENIIHVDRLKTVNSESNPVLIYHEFI
jgi:hypothetical protein